MPHLLKLSVSTLAACLLLGACGSSKSSTASSSNSRAGQTTGSAGATVKTASSSLGMILVDAQGMTLYHLSAEQNGKFICTSASCTGIWHPLTVPAGSTPSGEVGSLSTVKRPDGTTQVAYQGSPLYTFASDQQPGETKGQGVKDVGTWSAVTTGGSGAGSGTQTSAPSTGSSGGGGGGGYGY
jgi:predicted lipoprotein with Yx(FWY)xxD motif